jgi:hypothetical protein
MSPHERFEELCALAASGQLTTDEYVELTEHLQHCGPCQAAYEDFSTILRELPESESPKVDKALLKQLDESGLRDRFLYRARTGGIAFSSEVVKGARSKKLRMFRRTANYQWIAAAAAATIIVSLFSINQIKRASQPVQVPFQSQALPASASSPKTSDDLEQSLARVRQENSVLAEEAVRLKDQNTTLTTRLQAIDHELQTAIAHEQQIEASLSDAKVLNTKLESRNQETSALLSDVTAQLEKARADRSQAFATLAANTRSMEEVERMLQTEKAGQQREEQLLSEGRDIRDLMGARNLHIIDVYDADGKGKNRKSFGRVFYTEGRSLIFYAYDLDEKKLANAKYTFEAWGERLGQPATVKSLGLLYVDDKAEKRWVLKVDNPQQLAEIDSVFVTLEPHDGNGERPLGQKLLYAFLGSNANHP